MLARALICDQAQQFTLEEVRLPDPGPGTLSVRTLCSGVSIGTEFALIRAKISWGPYPLCTGYQAVGVVEAVGAGVQGFGEGDLVYFRDNKVMTRASGEAISAVTGTHSSHAVIDLANTHGCALLPEGVAPDVGSLFVMPAVGLFGTDLANPRMGQTVVVYGAGMIGLGVVAACVHRGCRVVAVDIDDHRLEVARKLGADYTHNSAREAVPDAVRALAPAGADVVFESTGIPALVGPAVELCREYGTFVWQGNYGNAPVPFGFQAAHGRKLTMVFPCDDGLAPCRRAVLRNIAMGALRWEHVITHRVAPEDSPALFDRINRNEAPDVLGAVICWDR